MSTFTIDSDNNIAAYAEVPAGSETLQSFTTKKELAKLAGDWPGSRLVEVWNSFAGVAPFTKLKPVKKFTDRKAAVARIWAAVQRLSPDAGEPGGRRRARQGETNEVPVEGFAARPDAKGRRRIAQQ